LKDWGRTQTCGGCVRRSCGGCSCTTRSWLRLLNPKK